MSYKKRPTENKDIVSNGKVIGWAHPMQHFENDMTLWRLHFLLGSGATVCAISYGDTIRYTFADEHGCHRAVLTIGNWTMHVDSVEKIEQVNELQHPLELLVAVIDNANVWDKPATSVPAYDNLD